MKDLLLWVEKYRQQTIDDCIFPEELKDTFREFVANKEIPNLLLSGAPGVGKTTVAKILCKEVGLDHLMINESEDGNIDTLRTKIRHYASTVSFSGEGKCVINCSRPYQTGGVAAQCRPEFDFLLGDLAELLGIM